LEHHFKKLETNEKKDKWDLKKEAHKLHDKNSEIKHQEEHLREKQREIERKWKASIDGNTELFE